MKSVHFFLSLDCVTCQYILYCDGVNNCCIPPTLEGWVYIIPTHEPLDGPLYTWAQYTPTY